MATQRKFFSGAVQQDGTLGERQIRVVASTPAPDRVKDVMVAEGCNLSNYQSNPIVLANHDPDHPIGTAKVSLVAGRLEALIEFAPAGASVKADEYCALAKAGVLSTVSVGYDPIDAEPLKGGGYKIKTWELLELSIVSIPCNPEAVVTQRSLNSAREANRKVGASQTIPVDANEGWDGGIAADSIFQKAAFDGEKPDIAFARKGFLVYDAANPKDRKSYSVPFAEVRDGRLVTSADALKDARAALDAGEFDDAIKAKAVAVIEHYEAKMLEDAAPVARKTVPKVRIKGMYQVAQLAYLLADLSYQEDSAEWEREMEGDASAVPEMLAAALRATADAFLAMTAEEVAELLGEEMGEDATKGLPIAIATKALAAKTSFAKALAIVRAKAGRTFSAANEKAMREACASIKSGHEAIAALLDKDDGDMPEEKMAESDTDKGVAKITTKNHRLVEYMRLIDAA